MKIGIIGFGYVGQAVAWAHREQNIIIRDPKLKDSAELKYFADCDGIYICVPSPSLEDGHCDTSVLEAVLKELEEFNDIVIISKTTAPPGTYKQLHKEYPNLVHSPEFLTQNNSAIDYANAEYCVLGGHHYWCLKAREIVSLGRKIVLSNHLITSIETAALYKYMMNSYLATKVTFMNDFKKLANVEKVNWEEIKHLAGHDNRIGKTHMDVPGPDGQFGWGGACFPKDIAAIQMEALDLNIELELLGRVEDINKKHRQENLNEYKWAEGSQ